MSALGQKQTCAAQKVMSAFFPKSGHPAAQKQMSAMERRAGIAVRVLAEPVRSAPLCMESDILR